MNDEKRKLRATQVLDDYLSHRGMRRTPERYAILERAIGFKRPFSLADLGASVAGGSLLVSRATLYNTMSLFCDARMARKVLAGGDADMWEMTDPSVVATKVRLLCTSCGKTREIRDPELVRILSLKRFTSFTPSFFELCVNGLCSRCRNAEKKKK